MSVDPYTASLSQINALQSQAYKDGITLRDPPPLPTTCCGKGCSGCVWESYGAACGFWIEDAEIALLKR